MENFIKEYNMNSHDNPDYVSYHGSKAYHLPYIIETTAAYTCTPHQIRKGCNGKNNQQKTYDYCCKSGTNACKKKYPTNEFNPWKDKSQCIYSPVRNHIIGGNGVRKQFRVLYLIYASIDKESPNIEPKNKRKVSMRKNCFDKKYRFHRDRCCII